MDSCTFRVGFPTVMKTQMMTEFKVDLPISLQKIQEIILGKFWEFKDWFPSTIIHGKTEQVTLIDRNTFGVLDDKAQVKDDTDFQNRLNTALDKHQIQTNQEPLYYKLYIAIRKLLGISEIPVVCFDAYFSKDIHKP